MPIHTDWKSMVQNMGRQYPSKSRTCREFTDGKKVCISDRAWSVFFATITKRYGRGAEMRPRKKVQESRTDELIDWYMRRLKNGTY